MTEPLPDTDDPLYYPEGPIRIRDHTVVRLIHAIREVNGRVFKARTLPTKDDLLPCIGVAHAGENGRPIGDANVGPPQFMCSLELALSIVAKADSDLLLDGRMTRLVEKVKQALFMDPEWLGSIEAIENFRVSYQYPREEDVTLCEVVLRLTLIYRSVWPPCATNSLEEIETTYQSDATADPITIISTVSTS